MWRECRSKCGKYWRSTWSKYWRATCGKYVRPHDRRSNLPSLPPTTSICGFDSSICIFYSQHYLGSTQVNLRTEIVRIIVITVTTVVVFIVIFFSYFFFTNIPWNLRLGTTELGFCYVRSTWTGFHRTSSCPELLNRWSEIWYKWRPLGITVNCSP